MSKSEGKLINEMQKKEMKKNRNFSIKTEMFVHPDLLFYSHHYTMHRQRVNVRDEFYSRVTYTFRVQLNEERRHSVQEGSNRTHL